MKGGVNGGGLGGGDGDGVGEEGPSQNENKR